METPPSPGEPSKEAPATPAAFPVHPVQRALRVSPEDPANRALRVYLETQVDHLSSRASQLLLLPASPVPRVHPDHLDLQAYQETPAHQDNPVYPAKTHHPESLARRDHPVPMEILERQERPESLECQPSQSHLFPESLDHQESQDRKDLPDHLDSLAATEHLVSLVRKVRTVPTDSREPTAIRVHQDPPDRQDSPANAVSVRSTARSTAVSSSRTEHDVDVSLPKCSYCDPSVVSIKVFFHCFKRTVY